MICLLTGEFGVVYKAILRRVGGATELVAVKALKGMSLMIFTPSTA